MLDSLQSGLTDYLQSSSALAFLVVYLGGVLVSFTPCVYPVMPLTVAFIGGYAGGGKGHGFFLSLVYVFGLSVVYALLGGIAALSGSVFGQLQSGFWPFFVVANVCILMGLSMLDVFRIAIPTPQFVTRVQPSRRTKGFVGSFFVGAASALVMGPCTTPVLGVLLAYVATRQHVLFGMGLMFVFAFGMGTLLIVLGTFAGVLANLPKGGVWMTRVSHFFGWIFLAMGEYFLVKAGMLW